MLRVKELQNAYGKSQVLFDVSFEVAEGQVVTLLGRNGMGKSTTVHSIFGLLPARAGRIEVMGTDVTRSRPHAIAKAGLGLVPEGRRVFPTLTVEENLLATSRVSNGGKWHLKRIYQLFPRLEERRGNRGTQLSGGEQQMVAIGRALLTNPRLLVLDEATEGLAPLIREEIWAVLEILKSEGQSILIVDKNVDKLVSLADNHIVLEKGHVVWAGSSKSLLDTPEIKERYLQV